MAADILAQCQRPHGGETDRAAVAHRPSRTRRPHPGRRPLQRTAAQILSDHCSCAHGAGQLVPLQSGPSSSAKERAKRYEMVGGQLLLITPRWGGSVLTAHADPTGLGILTEVILGAHGGDIQVLGTYFPCPCTAGTGHTNRLWDKAQAWLGGQGINQSPQAYLQTTIQGQVLCHLGRGATGTPPPS